MPLHHKIDILRRIIAGHSGHLIRRNNDTEFIGLRGVNRSEQELKTIQNASLFFIALHCLYMESFVTRRITAELKEIADNANRIWLSLPLPKDVNIRWREIRKEISGK